MADINRPLETDVTEQAAKPAELQGMDARITEADPAKSGDATIAKQTSEQAELVNAVADQQYSGAVEADSSVNQAMHVSDQVSNVEQVESAEKAALAGQMTDTPHFEQGEHPDCLLQSARMAEARQTGVDPGVESYKNEAIRDENYHEASGRGGVSDMPRFAEQMDARPGIDAEYQQGARLEDIKTSLDNGESVIVGVDTSEFYPEYGIPPDNGKHAVVVTGANQEAGGHWNITVNDSNDPGPNISVSETVFTKAWETAGNPMIKVHKAGGR